MKRGTRGLAYLAGGVLAFGTCLSTGCSSTPKIELPRTVERGGITYRVTEDAAFIVESRINNSLWKELGRRFRANIKYLDINGDLEVDHDEAFHLIYKIVSPTLDRMFEEVRRTRQEYVRNHEGLDKGNGKLADMKTASTGTE